MSQWDDPAKKKYFTDWEDDGGSGSSSDSSSSSSSDISDAVGPSQEEMREAEASRSSGSSSSSDSGGGGSSSGSIEDAVGPSQEEIREAEESRSGGGSSNDGTRGGDDSGSRSSTSSSDISDAVGPTMEEMRESEVEREERVHEQGVETGDGRISRQGQDLEQQVLEQNPELTRAGVAVEREGDSLTVSLNERGRRTMREETEQRLIERAVEETPAESYDDVNISWDDGEASADFSEEFEQEQRREAQRERAQYARGGVESADSRSESGGGERFGDINIPVPGTGNTVEDYLDAGAEAYDDVVEQAGSFASRATATYAYSDPTVSQLGYNRQDVTDPEAEIDNSFSRFMEGSTEGALQLGNVPATASGVKEAGEFVGWAATETAAGRGGEAAEQTGAAAASVGAAAASEAQKNPSQTAGMVAGSLVGSVGAMGGAARASSTAGRATRYAVQPGEEILSDAATGLAKRSTRGQRALDRIPGGRLDNEEVAIAAGRGAASRISDADISGSARAAASRARRAVEETRSPESRGLYASDDGELFSERNPLGTPVSTDLGEESVTRQIADRVTNPEPQSTYFDRRTGEPFTERNPLGQSLLAERTSTPEGPQTNDDVVVFEDLESSVESETNQDVPDADDGFDVDTDADASGVGSSGGGGFVVETETDSGQVYRQRFSSPRPEAEMETEPDTAVAPELDTEVETEFQRASEVADINDRATESGVGEGLGTNFDVGEISRPDVDVGVETGFENPTDTTTDTGLDTGLETGTSTETDFGNELETVFANELETELGLEGETESRTEAEAFGRRQNRGRRGGDDLFGGDDETFETGIWDIDDSGFSF